MYKLSFIILTFIPLYMFAQAPKKSKTLSIHGHDRIDEYYWMNERDSKAVLENLKQENEYANDYFKPLQPLINSLLTEFEQRINPNEVSAPFILNGKKYQMKNTDGKDYQQIILLEKNKELVFFDENERAKDAGFYDLADWSPSPNNELLAVSEDFIGRRKYSITFRENKSGKYLADKIEETSGGVVWANDNKTVYYIKKDPQTLREYQVYMHVLGTDSKSDVLIYQEDDEKFSVGLEKTITDKYIFVSSYSSTSSETWFLDANNTKEPLMVFLPRRKDHLYQVAHHLNGFYILSNQDAPNRKVLFAKSFPRNLEQCQVLIPVNPETLIEGISTFKNFLVLEERNNGLRKIKLRNLSSGLDSYISIDEETYSLNFGLNDDYMSDEIFYSYNSMTTPSTIFQYNMASNTKKVWFEKTLMDPSFKSSDYESQRIWATANDGEKIPVSIVYKKGIDLKTAPCLLYGYGSYGYTIPDGFSALRISLLNRGFVFASAHIRGSKYMGETWYEDGKLQKKMNTFTDFINAAEFIGHMGYCDKEKIYAQGGSAGGLLMGAIVNLAPYLWKGIVSQVPFVDVVTTMLDESIPLTTGEFEEWGNPNDPEAYYYMLKYSPYDNIHKMDYPAMFVTTGYHDSQVQYWEPMKYVAKLREYKTSANPLIFDCNMDAGHGGGSGRSNERLEVAKVYAFILGLEGILK